MTLTDTDEPCPMEGVVAKKEKSLSREELKALIEVVAQEPYNLGDKWSVYFSLFSMTRISGLLYV